ncbi:MAG: hypothetical protein CMB67_02100 [Euryarchaeota archaeon]|nr:hypothetical protein [Euryarchaeota archaeon]
MKGGTNGFKRGMPSLGIVTRGKESLSLVCLFVVSLCSQQVYSDSVISHVEVEILEAGSFQDSSEWEFSSTAGFSQEQAEYTIGMVADGKMSFTHSRPDNFGEYISWASSGCPECNATFGEPDGIYSWSMGPNITMAGYSFIGLQNWEIENVSLVLYFSIPDPLPTDEVNIILQNQGSDILVSSFAKTIGAVNRMSSPLILSLDGYLEWDWEKLEQTQFTIDYVSDNQGTDDSEVRVDSVGLKVKFHEPWYSFENSRAEHHSMVEGLPVIDFGPYEGHVSGISHENCGLVPDDSGNSTWQFDIEAPPHQTLGRIHVYGEGNYSIFSSEGGTGDNFLKINSGEIMEASGSNHKIRIEIHDGCISGARVDVNDPHLQVSGSVSGEDFGLSKPASSILFAIGGNLVHSEPMENGQFSFSVPVGYALPGSGEAMDVGIATRFQWSSNGTSETTVVHIDSMSISGGFSIAWDRDPICGEIGDVDLVEDEGGQIIPISSICSDDITNSESLVVSAHSSDGSLLEAFGDGSMLIIEPLEEASGEASVMVTVSDEVGNTWSQEVLVTIQEVLDPPEILRVPGSVYLGLDEEFIVEMEIYDPDSSNLDISTSKSWVTVNEDYSISINPVEAGTHDVEISVDDGSTIVVKKIQIVVVAKPDLLVESIEIRNGGSVAGELILGDVVEVIGFIRNQGRGGAENITFQCMSNGVLVGTGMIDELGPGDLKMAICDIQLFDVGESVSFSVEIDGIDSLDESVEENNILVREITVKGPSGESDQDGGQSIVVLVSILAVLSSIAFYKIGPKPVKKEFGRKK